jgi:isopentenyl-diphosphate delta-isomerase
MSEHVILVDANDSPIGTAEKLEAHRSGRLHRAFSAFVFNDRGELLLQRRAGGKYHSGGLWSNTCCSHPRPGEETRAAAERRLEEEMGFRCALEAVTAIVYRAEVGGGLVEYEYDHLLVGRWTGRPSPDPDEVEDWRWVDMDALRDEVAHHPRRFTYWFRVALRELDDRGLLPEPAHRVA